MLCENIILLECLADLACDIIKTWSFHCRRIFKNLLQFVNHFGTPHISYFFLFNFGNLHFSRWFPFLLNFVFYIGKAIQNIPFNHFIICKIYSNASFSCLILTAFLSPNPIPFLNILTRELYIFKELTVGFVESLSFMLVSYNINFYSYIYYFLSLPYLLYAFPFFMVFLITCNFYHCCGHLYKSLKSTLKISMSCVCRILMFFPILKT